MTIAGMSALTAAVEAAIGGVDKHIEVEGLLADWSASRGFGRGRLQSLDGQHVIALAMPLWKNPSPKSTLTRGAHVTVRGRLCWHPRYGLHLEPNQIRRVAQQLTSRAAHVTIEPQQMAIRTQPSRVTLIGPTGGEAAINDARSRLTQLPPHIEVTERRIPMSGKHALPSLAKALNAARASTDIVLIVRGGGSSIDLDFWNQPAVCQKIADCIIPIIVGIGHSNDTLEVNNVAWGVAITPTAAADHLLSLCANANCR